MLPATHYPSVCAHLWDSNLLADALGAGACGQHNPSYRAQPGVLALKPQKKMGAEHNVFLRRDSTATWLRIYKIKVQEIAVDITQRLSVERSPADCAHASL